MEDFGFITQYRPRIGFCTSEAVAPDEIRPLVRLGRDLLTVPSGGPAAQLTHATLFRRR